MPKRLFDGLTLFGRARLDVTTTMGAVHPAQRRYAVTPPRNTKYAPGSGTQPSVAASGVKGKITPISRAGSFGPTSPSLRRASSVVKPPREA